jgi:hypothetical protein
MEPLLETEDASRFLKRLGVRRAPGYLRKLRCTGGGPPFQYLNRRPYYTPSGLIQWVEARLSEQRSSTSEPAERLARRTGPNELAEV